MKKIKVVLDFIKLSVTEKISFYRNAITKLSTNGSTFSNPDIRLEDVKSLVDSLEERAQAAKDGGRAATAAMYAAEEVADNAFRILAAFVDRIANGDETIILSSGFNISKQPVTSKKPDLSVENGIISGSVKLVAKAVEMAGAYIWQYAKDTMPANESDWLTAGHSTRATFELSGLDIASKYWFRVAAITPDGTTDFTPAVLKIVI
ncbi:MAG: hypothetical protein Q8928_00335 [Bacteroidota bacterium]|nr:hypothetical protein [Bacteroidota bacterium]